MSPQNEAEVQRFEQWQRGAEDMPDQGVQDPPPQGWFDSHSAFANLPHPNSEPEMLPGSIAWLYQDHGGEA